MPKRPQNTRGSGPIDIFDDDIERATEALAAATAPAPDGTSAPPSPAETGNGAETPQAAPPKLVEVPVPATSPSRTAQERQNRPTRAEVAKGVQQPSATQKTPEPAPEAPQQVLEKNVGLKFRVPQSVKSDFQTFMAELSAALGGVSLDDSNVGRPVLELLLLEHRETILQAAKQHRGELTRPVNRDAVAMAEFDEALGAIIREGVATRRRGRAGRARG